MIFFSSCKLLIFNTHCYLCFFLFVFSWTVLADLCGPFTSVMWWRGIYSKARGKIAVKLKALAMIFMLKIIFMFHLKCKLIRAVLSQIYFWTHIWKGKLLWMTVIILTVPTLTMTEFFCQNFFFFFCLALPCVDPNRHIPGGGSRGEGRHFWITFLLFAIEILVAVIHENSVLFENVVLCK